MDILLKAESVIRVADKSALEEAMEKLMSDEALRNELGMRAQNAIAANNGATEKNLSALKKLPFGEQK